MNEGISKQIQCECDSKELCLIFTMIMQGIYHNLEGAKEESREGEGVKEEERGGGNKGWMEGGREAGEGRQKKLTLEGKQK